MPNRITRRRVPPLYPAEGPIHTVVIGEAPGPRGADQSLIPFWGDRAGALTYRALRDAHCATWPGDNAHLLRTGRELLELGIKPTLTGVLLTNAFASCPTDDGHSFRAPSRTELTSSANVRRLRKELRLAVARGCRQVLALGRVSAHLVPDHLAAIGAAHVQVIPRPHPSAQGLLQAAPNKGKGRRLADLEAKWIREVVALLRATKEELYASAKGAKAPAFLEATSARR